jgi:hypothetical protein
MVNEMTRPNKWVLEKRTCEYEDGIHRVIKEYETLPSIPLRNATLGDSFFQRNHGLLENDGDTYGSDLEDSSCYDGKPSYSMILKLGPSPLTRRHTSDVVLTDATLEVGSFSSRYARYIMFEIEAPLDALAYDVFVAGHCLPDPPGHVYVVGYLHPGNIGEVNRNYCLNLRSALQCNEGRVRFTVRIRFGMAHSPLLQGVVRLRSKGVYRSICPGKYRGNIETQRGSLMHFL